MKATIDCLECFVRQSLKAARLATEDVIVQRKIVEEVARRLPEMDLERSPAVLSQVCYDLTREYSGNPDPYREAKKTQNAMALALEAEMRARVQADADPLTAALHLAAAGNVIDLGTMNAEDIDIRVAIDEAMHQRFAVDHSEAFKASLEHCNDLLYLLDNAGEIVFDKILIGELQKYTQVTAVVKAAPILNDVLLEDAEAVGLTEICEVIDNGGAFIGAPLELVPERFHQRMHAADVIIGKGQGNYETIDDFPGDVYLILKAKCPVVARHMGVEYGQVAMISTRLRNLQADSA